MTANFGTIFTWVPRFAYNKNNEILYLKAVSGVAGDYTTPKIFTYEASGVNSQDLALRGIWVEQKNTLGNVSTKLNSEENGYGLIANTKAEYGVLDKNFINAINKDNETGIKNIGNYKIILKVIDEKLTEPIMAKLSAKGKNVTIKITKTDNGIREVRAENGNICNSNEEKTEFTYTVEKGGLNKFIIIDNIGNQREYEINIASPEIYVVTNQDDYVEFNGEKWYPYGTVVRIQYMNDMTDLKGYYKQINGTLQTPVAWTDNSTNPYRDFTLTETMKYEAKIENSLGEILGEDEATIHIMPRYDTAIQTNYYTYNVGGIYPVQVTGSVNTTSANGTEIYSYNMYLKYAAVHMGLIEPDETKVLYIKIVPSPQGGYIGSTRNGVTTTTGSTNVNGYIFVTKDGEEIKIPTINNISQKSEDNKITVTVDAVSYNADKKIEKYYYSIDSTNLADYIETDSNEYVFNDVQSYKNHTIRVYVKDSYGITSSISTITTREGSALPTPTIEIVNEETLDKIEYDGKTWYPYGTQIKINYAEDMTNLTGQYKTINEITGVESGWSNTSGATYQITTYETTTYIAKLKDSTGKETEEVRFTINIMPNTQGTFQVSYYSNGQIGTIYPIRLMGYDSGSIYGTDIYMASSSYIQRAAVHMGLATRTETKDLFIKIVLSPEGGYKASTKNGITSIETSTTNTNGYIFVTREGAEIRSPKIESTVLTSGENTISTTVSATASVGEIEKYYYRIDNGAFIESNSNVYEFTDVLSYKSHTMQVYVKDTNGAISDTVSITGKTKNSIPIPTIEIVDEDTLETIEYDGKVWYPYGTQVKITYAEDMTNLTGYYKCAYDESKTETGWYSNSNKEFTTSMNESGSFTVKLKDSTGEESEEVSIHLNIMAYAAGLQSNYYTYGLNKIYPVRVKGERSGAIYGTDTYTYNTQIRMSAMHMGLVQANETKDLFIKVVETPEGGYKESTRNGLVSSTNIAVNGYIFVTKDGKEIKSPTLNTLTTIGGQNSISATIDINCTNSEPQEYYYAILEETTYQSNTSSNKDYYKQNPTRLTFYKSEEKTYQFTVEPYKNYRIIAYAKDTNGATSELYDVIGKAANEVPKPIIEIVDKDTLETVEYGGKTWYPNGTKVKITYAEDLTNLTPYYNWHLEALNSNSWVKDSNTSIETTANISMKYFAKNVALTGEEAKTELTINIIPGEYLDSNYPRYFFGQTFPVIVTGSKNGTIYGTEVYKYNSYIAKAAMQMGLVQEGETKQLFVKVVENPNEYYKAVTVNGITSSEYFSKDKGYVFVDKNGNEIKHNASTQTGDVTLTIPKGTKYIELYGEKYYSAGTQIIINYTGSGTNYYTYKSENSNSFSKWNNIGTNSSYTTTIDGTTTFLTKIEDLYGNIIAKKSFKVNIASFVVDSDFDPDTITSDIITNDSVYNENVGSICKVQVKGTTSGSVWGTDIYTADSNVSKAATHAGLVNVGETKIVYVKIIEGKSSYSGSTRNGVTTSNWNSYGKSYIFILMGENSTETSDVNISPIPTETSNDVTITVPENTTYVEYKGEKWYPYGTKVTINYIGTGTHYYAYRNEVTDTTTSLYNIGTSTTENLTINESTTFFTRITDELGDIAVEKSTKVNIMPQSSSIGNTYNNTNAIGKTFPVQVTYSTSGNCYGTNVYSYASNINTAATHMGLVKSGETKVVYIKIVNQPIGGYVSSFNNGVTTQKTGGHNGFVFVDENGNEIIDNSYVPEKVGATLSGYDVINNNTNTVNSNQYTFINDGTSIIPTNSKVTSGSWITASSYIEIDLTKNSSELYTITLNAEISSDNRNTGYAIITENTTPPSGTSGFVSIRGQIAAQDYSTILLGGKKYYLHLGYYKYIKYNSYEDVVRFNSLKVEKLSDIENPTITVDENVTPVEYKGELWYPYNTQVTINYNEDYDKRYYRYEYGDGTSSSFTASSTSRTITCNRPMTIKAGHTSECSESSLKVNIMPNQSSIDKTFYDNIGTIYPVQVTGYTGYTIYGTAKYSCTSPISTPAVHMGLVDVNETKTVYIKIIEFPQGGYKGTRQNGITSNSYSSTINGYVFVDENGEEILEPILHSNATLSGYKVYPNGGYYFEQLGDSISCSSPYGATDSESYIELDLSEYSKQDMIKVNLNMEISGYYYGCAAITKTKDKTAYSNSTGRFIYVSGTKEAKNYATIIPGGEKYYLHLASYRYNNSSKGENQVKFNSLEVTQIPNDKKPIIKIDENVEPVEYKGELWYPYGTKVTISYIEEDCNYTNIYIDNKEYLWYKYKNEISGGEYSYYNNGNYTPSLSESTTFWAKYSDNSPEETLKINIMPCNTYISSYYNSLGNIYPIQITGNSGGGYGNNIYLSRYVNGRITNYTQIDAAATHMGLVDVGETKVVYVKFVQSPAGGYVGVTKNGIKFSSVTNNVENGFMFVTEDGTEILEPIINSGAATIGDENSIVATVNAVGQNGAEVQKYYYSIDNGPYIESAENTYTFTDIESYKTHTVKIYVRDNRGAVSQTKEIVTSVVSNNVTPTITLDENAIPIEYNGELWYPYGTKLTINYAEDMTNLTSYYAYIDERTGTKRDWTNHSTNKTYTTTLNHSVTYMAKIADKSGNETEVATKTIHIMPDGTNGATYYASCLGNIYPVRVTGTTSGGGANGEDTYVYTSDVSVSATHMGLLDVDETKVVLIKIVPAPVGGYKGTLRNEVQTYNNSYTYNGYVFIDENGNEITRPKINSVVSTSGDNTITVTVNAESNNGEITKYYYSIDNKEYVETTSNIHTFDNVTIFGNHTIKVYVKDSNGDISSIKEFYGHINTLAPTFTFNNEPIIYNGEKWYPYGTSLQINFSSSNAGYYRSVNVYSTNSVSSWTTTRSWPCTVTLNESKIYEAYQYNSVSGESEHTREQINIMAHPSSLQPNYYNYGSGKVYPVQVTGTKSGAIYGTDTYECTSNISKAATHAGLVEVGETKLLYIKIVPCPEGGYIGSTQNGITSNEYSTTNVGYTFVK